MDVSWRYNTTGAHRYFRCHKMSKTVTSKTCPAPASVQEAKAERILIAWLQEHAEGQKSLDAAIARAQAVDRAEVDLTKIAREIARVQKRMSILYDDKVKEEVSPAVYKIKEAELLAELERLEASKETSTVSVEINSLPSQTTFGALLKGWEHLSPQVFNQGLKAVVRHLLVTKAPNPHGHSLVRVVGAWEPDLRTAPVL